MPWIQLARYFAGELNREDAQKMENWIKADPERAKKVNELYHIWKESEIPPYELSIDDAWARLSDGMVKLEKEENTTIATAGANGKRRLRLLHQTHTKLRKPLRNIRHVWVAAATVLIIITAGLFTFHVNSGSDQDVLAEHEPRILITQDGERASYQLKDGSRVVLHAGSRLEIPANYNEELRELHLEGEAYFETAHDSEKPFIVHSGNSYTRVLGTRFLVQAWNRYGESVEVVVSEGKVLFGDKRTLDSDERRETVLTQNQRGTLGNNQAPEITDITDIDWYLGWIEGRLVFENRPLREVLPRLERWYDLDIIVEDTAIADKRITAEIDYSLPMSDVLQGVAMTLDLEVEREGRTVIFR